MAAKKNKKLKTDRWAWARTAGHWLVGKTRTGIAALGLRGALLCALALAALWGIYIARGAVGEMPQFRVYPDRFRAKAPDWCAADLATVQFPLRSYSIFDPRLTREVAETYLASPWVGAVVAVEKRFPNEIRVELELRKPAAFVRLPRACAAIDKHAVHLPLDYRRWDHDAKPLPLVFGVKTDPPCPGGRWPDRSVTAAASVLRILGTAPDTLSRIHVIDVGNLEGDIDPLRSEILLFTRRRVRIHWGRPPDTTKFGEPAAAEKLARLRRCLATPLAQASTIDLRFPDDSGPRREAPNSRPGNWQPPQAVAQDTPSQ